MKTQFGEFQFGYSCTRELENGGTLFPALGPPLIPTQVEEGDDLPFDAIFGALFLQYKVPDYLTTRGAREYRRYRVRVPYFRIDIYPEYTSHQHNMMREFAKDKVGVYYCAPAFMSYDEYAELHLGGQIAERSAFIPVEDLPANSKREEHSIVYNINPLEFKWCSDEPTSVDAWVGASSLFRALREDRTSFARLEEILPRVERVVARLPEVDRRPGLPPRRLQLPVPDERVPRELRELTEIATRSFTKHGLVLALIPLEARGRAGRVK